MQVTLVTISYPNLPFSIAYGDARILTFAMAKAFAKIVFSREEEGDKVTVKAEISSEADPQLTERHLRAWAQGFMASSHLWER
jgi:hypothetical protein